MGQAKDIAALFCMRDSVYKNYSFVDVYDKERNALNWRGGVPAIFHPPCRSWGTLRKFSHFEPGEKWLFPWSVIQVRRYGGVIEHPRTSLGWRMYCFEAFNNPGIVDAYGGFYFDINQFWFGHKAQKKTGLYIVGILPKDLPPYPLRFDAVQHTVSSLHSRSAKKEISKKERSATPIKLAEWLMQVARMCQK